MISTYLPHTISAKMHNFDFFHLICWQPGFDLKYFDMWAPIFFWIISSKYTLSFSSQFNSGLKSGEARTNRGRNNIVYRVHFLGAFCGFKKFTSFKMQPTFRALRSTGDFVRFPNCKSWTDWESGYNICWICSITDHKSKFKFSFWNFNFCANICVVTKKVCKICARLWWSNY